MRRGLVLAVVGTMLLFTLGAEADTSYSIAGTASYQFGAPAGALGVGGCPDTSFVTFTNTGASTFTGTVGGNAVSGFGTDFSTSYAVTLAPGATVTFNPTTSCENSNQGGFGGAFGTLQNGIDVFLNGTFTNGADTTGPLLLDILDSNIHSGISQTNPFGVTLDNYILQGGDPFGRDTGDAFETAQAIGTFGFTHNTGAVPEPATLALLGSGLIGLAGQLRKRLM